MISVPEVYGRISNDLRPGTLIFSCQFIGFLMCCVTASSSLFADQPLRPEVAKVYLGEYSKLLQTLQESRFSWTTRSVGSTPSEGIRAKDESSGTISVSAARKMLHYTRSGTTTWIKGTGPISADQGTTEVLVTSDSVLTVLTSRNKYFGVELKQHVSADDWSNELRGHPLGVFLGYAPDTGPKESVERTSKSLLSISQSSALMVAQGLGDDLKGLVGFVAKTDDWELRVLFDPAQDHQVRQIDLTRPVEKIEPFAMVKETVRILEIQHKSKKPSLIKFKIVTEQAGGVILRSELPANAVLTPSQKKSGRIEREPLTVHRDVEITNIQYDESPQSKWDVLENAIPDGTTVRLTGDEQTPYFWQDGQVKPGFPPPSEEEIQREMKAAFDHSESSVKRYSGVQRKLNSLHQHCLIIFADPQHPSTRSLYATHLAHEDHQLSLDDFHTLAISTNMAKLADAQALSKLIGVTVLEDAMPLLVITDERGKILGQLGGKNLAGTDMTSIDPVKIDSFLKRNSLEKVDARTLLADAMTQARRENKRIFLQQTSPWCGPCRLLTEFLNQQRSIWEKDYVWIKIDGRWLNAEEVMKPIRKDDSGGIPWIAILDTEGKLLATSDNSAGANIGFPARTEPDGIDHFIKMLKSTSQRMNGDDLNALKKALKGN